MVSNRPFICTSYADDVPSLFKAKDFLKDLRDKMKELENEVSEVRLRMTSVEKNTNFEENANFKEAIW